MIEFEPLYVQVFFRYLKLRELIAHALCGIDLCSEGRSAEDSVLIRSAIAESEEFLSGPDEALLSMSVELKGRSPNAREEILEFLRIVLSPLKGETRLSEDEYSRMFNSLMDLHDGLVST